MIGFERASRILEFSKILSLLAECTYAEGAKEKILSLKPETVFERVILLQDETTTAKNLVTVHGAPSFGNMKDITSSVERAQKGASLSPRELLDVASVLRTIATMSKYRGADPKWSSLSVYFDTLMPNQFLEKAISLAIVAEDIISDDASDTLYTIRRNMRKAENSIRDTLSKYTGGPQNKYLQENIVTMRGGRFVIPVKAEYRNEVKGLLHDTSASGATLFIEPIAILEANNTLRELKVKEAAEIERILYELSSKVGNFADTLLRSYNALVELAVIFAKAELSFRLNCAQIELTEQRSSIVIKKGRHPLLPKETVVPLTLEIGEEIDTVVITGPNTGGKTVTLKTVGLFALMAQCGLHLPCTDGTKMPIFDAVLPDIGDEQSIEQSLSTFSSHISNIVDIIGIASNRSLVLFDELGAGTDPVEGAALAISIIEKIRSLGAFTMATTHYAEIKMYALENENVLNASCEFDVETLKPTYRIITGIPGRSNAFAISTRLGIDESIIDRARELMSDENKRFEDIITKLQATEHEMQGEREAARLARIEADTAIAKTKAECDALVEKANKEAERAVVQAEQILKNARATSDYVLAQLEEAKKNKDKENYAKALEEARNNIRDSLKSGSTRIDPATLEDENYTLPRELRKGDRVMVKGMSKVGTVESVDSKNAMVQFDKLTMKVPLTQLKLCVDVPVQEKKKTRNVVPQRTHDLKHEIDVRGQYGDDAWFMIDRYIDTAILEGYSSVNIIHGKGTGALRTAIWNNLRHDRRVKSYRLGTYGEGDSGVTVLELK
ncbi:MAG: endonuclease MutS2 [Clostridia bacterium]|nr:endonuclease MutS2 [Clostridia bacterium]